MKFIHPEPEYITCGRPLTAERQVFMQRREMSTGLSTCRLLRAAERVLHEGHFFSGGKL